MGVTHHAGTEAATGQVGVEPLHICRNQLRESPIAECRSDVPPDEIGVVDEGTGAEARPGYGGEPVVKELA
jgi:hypothetical protein